MKIGSRVEVLRGSRSRSGKGSLRHVVGTLLAHECGYVMVRLEQDDPFDTVGWSKAGDIGVWREVNVWEWATSGTEKSPVCVFAGL